MDCQIDLTCFDLQVKNLPFSAPGVFVLFCFVFFAFIELKCRPTIKNGKAALKVLQDTEIPSSSKQSKVKTPSSFISCSILKLKSFLLAVSYHFPLQQHGVYSGDDRAVGCVEVCCSLNSIAQLSVI